MDLILLRVVKSFCLPQPSPKKFWRIVLALRELAVGRCRRTGAHQPGSRTRNVSVRTHFVGLVGRVWASVRREFRTALALLPCAKGDLSRPWRTTIHAADPSLSGRGVAARTAS